MKKYYITACILGVLLLISCHGQSSDDKKMDDSVKVTEKQADSVSAESKKSIEEFLVIYGKDIWVRDVPLTGQVVMKLNEGDKCRILQKSELSFVKGLPDYWYQIEFSNILGWVFGSQTSLAIFEVMENPFTGNLNTCSDEIVSLSETPASYSYVFKPDQTFVFIVAAGYTITGKYSWSGGLISLSPLKLTVSSPDGNVSQSLSGTINFSVYRKDEIICLGEKENKLANKDYAPKGGCFCSE